MKWHRGSPTTPGWYWYRPERWEELNEKHPRVDKHYPRCLRLVVENEGLYTERDGLALPDLTPCEWAGPIPEPTEGRNHDKR